MCRRAERRGFGRLAWASSGSVRASVPLALTSPFCSGRTIVNGVGRGGIDTLLSTGRASKGKCAHAGKGALPPHFGCNPRAARTLTAACHATNTAVGCI
jgi:hypothetical protein